METPNYAQIIQELLTKYSQGKPAYGDIEVETLFDKENDRYQIIHMGWHHQRRIHHCVMHLDVRDGKVWIFHNTTEHELTTELMERGIPKTDIVLGFIPPEMRELTEFAVN